MTWLYQQLEWNGGCSKIEPMGYIVRIRIHEGVQITPGTSGIPCHPGLSRVHPRRGPPTLKLQMCANSE